MIGDRIDDIDAAKNLGIDSIAVRYGFGNDEEFKNAVYIAARWFVGVSDKNLENKIKEAIEDGCKINNS